MGNWIRITVFTALMAAGLALSSCGGGPKASGKPRAVASIFSYYDALRAIAGPDVEAEILLPKMASPHDYVSTAQDKETVDKAGLIIRNGLGLDDWMENLSQSNPTAIKLSIGDQIGAIQTSEQTLPGQEKEAEDTVMKDRNPHVWLDPMNQIKAAEMIRDALIKLDPAHKAGFEERAAAYIGDLKKLDADFRATTATFTHREFIGFHSAYDYLARRYGLVQAAAIQEIGTGGINPKQLETVETIIKERHIPVVFTESDFGTQQADLVAKDTGAKLGVLEPLETYNSKDETYVGLMRKNLAEMKRTMQ